MLLMPFYVDLNGLLSQILAYLLILIKCIMPRSVDISSISPNPRQPKPAAHALTELHQLI